MFFIFKYFNSNITNNFSLEGLLLMYVEVWFFVVAIFFPLFVTFLIKLTVFRNQRYSSELIIKLLLIYFVFFIVASVLAIREWINNISV